MNRESLGGQLVFHEGKKLTCYRDPVGLLTVGVGRNVEANPTGKELGRNIDRVGMEITDEEVMKLLDDDIECCAAEVRAGFDGFDTLSEPRQHVLMDMAFNMGTHGLFQFKKMLAAIRQGNFGKAADEMLNSKWATDVKNRSKRLALMMRDNVPFEEAKRVVP